MLLMRPYGGVERERKQCGGGGGHCFSWNTLGPLGPAGAISNRPPPFDDGVLQHIQALSTPVGACRAAWTYGSASSCSGTH